MFWWIRLRQPEWKRERGDEQELGEKTHKYKKTEFRIEWEWWRGKEL